MTLLSQSEMMTMGSKTIEDQWQIKKVSGESDSSQRKAGFIDPGLKASVGFNQSNGNWEKNVLMDRLWQNHRNDFRPSLNVGDLLLLYVCTLAEGTFTRHKEMQCKHTLLQVAACRKSTLYLQSCKQSKKQESMSET